jgi:hypothetical protein
MQGISAPDASVIGEPPGGVSVSVPAAKAQKASGGVLEVRLRRVTW